MSDYFDDDADISWEEMTWSEAASLSADMDTAEFVDILNAYEFSEGEFTFYVEMDDNQVVSISVDLEDMAELYELLEEFDFDFYMQYEDA